MSVFDLSGAPADSINRLIHYFRPEAWNFQTGTKPMAPTTVLGYVREDLPCPIYFHGTEYVSDVPGLHVTVIDGPGQTRVHKYLAPSPNNIESAFDHMYGILQGMTKEDPRGAVRIDAFVPNLLLDHFDIWIWRPDPCARSAEWRDFRYLLNAIGRRRIIQTNRGISTYLTSPMFTPLYFEVENLERYLLVSSGAWCMHVTGSKRAAALKWLKETVLPHAKALLETPAEHGLCKAAYWNRQVRSSEFFTKCLSTWYRNIDSVVCEDRLVHDPDWYVDWAKTKQVIELSPHLYPLEKEVYDIHPRSILPSAAERIPSEIKLWAPGCAFVEAGGGKRVEFQEWVRPFEMDLLKLAPDRTDTRRVVTFLSDLIRGLVTVKVAETPVGVYEVYPRFRHCMDRKVDIYVTLPQPSPPAAPPVEGAVADAVAAPPVEDAVAAPPVEDAVADVVADVVAGPPVEDAVADVVEDTVMQV